MQGRSSPGPSPIATTADAVWNATRASEIIAAHSERQGSLLPILHDLQAEFGYLPPPACAFVADALNLSRAEVHGVITFYHDFRVTPPGRRVLKLCRAEACQARGGRAVEAAAAKALGPAFDGTSVDGRLTVEAVYCLGLCASGPAALLDGQPLGRLTPEGLRALLEAA